MAVDAAAIAGFVDVLDVRVEGVAEQLDELGVGLGRVVHGLAPRDGLFGDGAARLGTAELELADGGGLVGRTVLAVPAGGD